MGGFRFPRYFITVLFFSHPFLLHHSIDVPLPQRLHGRRPGRQQQQPKLFPSGRHGLFRPRAFLSQQRHPHTDILQWIASTSCSTTACAGTKGRQYDPSISGVATQSNFSIQYLAGNVSGPIYWDEVQVGGYTIDNQALGTALPILLRPLLLTHILSSQRLRQASNQSPSNMNSTASSALPFPQTPLLLPPSLL